MTTDIVSSSPLRVALAKGASVETLAEKYVREFQDVVELFTEKRFDLDYPEIYERRNAEWVAVPHTFGDVYELCSFYAGRHSLTDNVDEDLEGLVLVTCGWGAPLNAEGEVVGAPSEHPERRRLSLIYGAGCDGSLNALMVFQDGEQIEGAGGTGALFEAMEAVGACAWKKEWVRGVFANYALHRVEVDLGQESGEELENLTEWYAHRVANLMRFLGHETELENLQDDADSDTVAESQ